jgi:hypothetical protein
MSPVVVLGNIYTDGVTETETPVVLLYEEFDTALVHAPWPVVLTVDTETVEKEMIRALQPRCPPVLFSLPRAIPKILAAIKAKADGVLVIVDPLEGPSTTTHLMLMACDTVVFPFDGTRESCSSLRLFLNLVPSWLEHYKQILRSHRPRIVVFAPELTVDLAEGIVSRLCPFAVVVAGPISVLARF